MNPPVAPINPAPNDETIQDRPSGPSISIQALLKELLVGEGNNIQIGSWIWTRSRGRKEGGKREERGRKEGGKREEELIINSMIFESVTNQQPRWRRRCLEFR